MALTQTLSLSEAQRAELEGYLRMRNLRASVAQRMRILLMLADGASYREVMTALKTTAPTISLWKSRYRSEGVIGLTTLHPGQPPQKLTPSLRARILARTQEAPKDGSTHWSLRKMAAVIGVGKELVRWVWKEADLKPHRMERYLASNDRSLSRRPRPLSAVPQSTAACGRVLRG